MSGELRKYRRRTFIAALVLAIETGGLVAAYYMNARALERGHELGTRILERGLAAEDLR